MNVPSPVINDDFSGDAWNKLRESVRSQQPIAAPGILTAHTVHGIAREAEPVPVAYGREDGASDFKLFAVTTASPDSDDAVRCKEIGINANGGWTGVASDLVVAKPFHLRIDSKPGAGAFVYPGYAITANLTGGWITGVPRSWGLIVGFKPAFGTGTPYEWMDTGMIFRSWMYEEIVCNLGVTSHRAFAASAAY